MIPHTYTTKGIQALYAFCGVDLYAAFLRVILLSDGILIMVLINVF